MLFLIEGHGMGKFFILNQNQHFYPCHSYTQTHYFFFRKMCPKSTINFLTTIFTVTWGLESPCTVKQIKILSKKLERCQKPIESIFNEKPKKSINLFGTKYEDMPVSRLINAEDATLSISWLKTVKKDEEIEEDWFKKSTMTTTQENIHEPFSKESLTRVSIENDDIFADTSVDIFKVDYEVDIFLWNQKTQGQGGNGISGLKDAQDYEVTLMPNNPDQHMINDHVSETSVINAEITHSPVSHFKPKTYSFCQLATELLQNHGLP